MDLILATSNVYKKKEIEDILKGIPLTILCLKDLDRKVEIEEGNKSFYDNAQKKAVTVSSIYRESLVIGEDSGLEVDYLGGDPGVLSARFSGEASNYKKNNEKLLSLLKGVDKEKRKAEFTTIVALAKDGKLIRFFKGTVNGYITDKVIGKQGFGYDPVFYIPSENKTYAQLSAKRKNAISHRAKAFFKVKKFIERFLEKSW